MPYVYYSGSSDVKASDTCQIACWSTIFIFTCAAGVVILALGYKPVGGSILGSSFVFLIISCYCCLRDTDDTPSETVEAQANTAGRSQMPPLPQATSLGPPYPIGFKVTAE